MPAQAVASANVQTYLERVDQLYAAVRGWLAALEPDARFTETPIELDEEATGPYQARSLGVARNGKPPLNLAPRGRYMVGAEGLVDVRSPLGRETLVWVRTGAPALGFRSSGRPDEALEELRGRPMFPGVAEGWAWADEDHGRLVHLDAEVFREHVLRSLGDA